MQLVDTNWYVVTGGPGSGKTKTIEYLAFLGYSTVSEAARKLVDLEMSKGKTVEEVRRNEKRFQRKVLAMKVDVEEKIPPGQITFFDRGIPDSLAYYRLSNMDEAEVVNASKRKYKGVFFLDSLPYEKDYARIEDEKTAKKLHQLLYTAYTRFGYKVIKVPVMPIDKRAKFILSKISK
ncbi:MAG: hypothetical protein A2172_00515 [Candidatus Woykebacteria bacterium RBG_13_40_15]|uniref:NadR/Ttd14 AAA domain-containing protein n=1 Tax=Candidatus Woykebacteria bacterium RBG_13_40_15 TaxID=1802593 RepID=A0A1G1W9I0_9BACT|nr:MAG: hypothetical protein A2172_00515 [Candidatus Woykebacteria bacterium RBG_13_40_15]